MRKISKKLMLALITAMLVLSMTGMAHAAVKLSKKSATLYVGKTLTLKVKGTTKKVTWSTSSKKVAKVSNGKVTAKKAGKATITAKVGSKKYTCKITVKKPYLNKTSLTLKKGKTFKLKLTGTAIKSVSTNNKKIAKIAKTGMVTAVGAGKCKLTIKGKDNKKYVCNVVVTSTASKDTKKPAAETEKPASQTEKPAAETEKPASQTEKPAAETEKPGSQTKPAAETEKPAPQTEKPAAETEKPVPQTEKPAAETEKPAPQTEKPTPQTEKPEPETEKPAPVTTRTVSNASELEEALKDSDLKEITLDTQEEGPFSIPNAERKDVRLVIHAPNGEVVNSGIFELIHVKAIAGDTFIEKASGNRIIFDAVSGRILLDGDTDTIIEVADQDAATSHDLIIENYSAQGGGCELILGARTNVTVAGDGGTLKLTAQAAGEGSTVTASGNLNVVANTPVTLNVVGKSSITLDAAEDRPVTLNLLEGSENTVIRIADESCQPRIKGTGSVTVINTSTGESSEVLAEYDESLPASGSVKISGKSNFNGTQLYLIPYTAELNEGNAASFQGQAIANTKVLANGTFSFSNIPYGNYILAGFQESYVTLIQNLVLTSKAAPDDAYDAGRLDMVPLLGQDGLFAVQSVDGPGVIDYEEWAVVSGRLELKGTAGELAEFEVTFKDSEVSYEIIRKGDPSFADYRKEYGEEAIAFVCAQKGIYDVVFQVTYTNEITAEELLEVHDVTGEYVYDYAKGYDLDWDGNDCELMRIGTDCIDEYPELTIHTAKGVQIEIETKVTQLQWGTYNQTATLTYGEEGSEFYAQKKLYITYYYMDSEGNTDTSGLFTIEGVDGPEVDGWEASNDGYYYSLYVYYDREENESVPADMAVTLTGGYECAFEVKNISENEYPNYEGTLRRGIWTQQCSVIYMDSFILRKYSLNGAVKECNGNCYEGEDPYFLLYTSAWDDYPQLEALTPQYITSEVSWEPYGRYRGSITLSSRSGKQKIYGIDLRYNNSTKLNNYFMITDVSAEGLDGYRLYGSTTLYLYSDVEGGMLPTRLNVTIQNGEELSLVTEKDEFDEDVLVLHSGLWSKSYDVVWMDSLQIKTVTLEESHGVSAFDYGYIKGYHLNTSVWDHYPEVTVQTDPNVNVSTEVSWEPYEQFDGTITVTGSTGSKVYGLELGYFTGSKYLSDIRFSGISGNGLDDWKWESGVGLHLYYDTKNTEMPTDLAVTLSNGQEAEVSVNTEAFESSDTWKLHEMIVHSGIWTWDYSVYYEDSFRFDDSDLKVSDCEYYVNIYEDMGRISIPTTAFYKYPTITLSTHNVEYAVEWISDSTYPSEIAGYLTLKNDVREESWGIELNYTGSPSLEECLAITNITAEEILDGRMDHMENHPEFIWLYSREGELPAQMQVSTTESTKTVDLLHEGDDESWGYYMEVTAGIWKKRYDLGFILNSMNIWKPLQVTGEGITGFGFETDAEGNNVYLDIYGTGTVLPEDMNITFKEGITLETIDSDETYIWGKLHLGYFYASVAVNYRTRAAVNYVEEAREASQAGIEEIETLEYGAYELLIEDEEEADGSVVLEIPQSDGGILEEQTAGSLPSEAGYTKINTESQIPGIENAGDDHSEIGFKEEFVEVENWDPVEEDGDIILEDEEMLLP